jgi:hypothetical protein
MEAMVVKERFLELLSVQVARKAPSVPSEASVEAMSSLGRVKP